MSGVSQETINHLSELTKILTPFLYVIGVLAAAIVSLIVWAWKKMERAQDKLMLTIETHMKNDDEIHDELFNRVRAVEQILVRAATYHEMNHPGQRLGDPPK